MKGARLGAAALAVAMLATACSKGSDGSGSGSTGAAAGSGKKITVWIMEGTNKDSKAYFDEVTKEFKAKTGADLDVQLVPWAGAHDKFTTAIAGKTTPDVAEMGNTWTAEFADAGSLTDLSDKVAGVGGKDAFVDGLVVSGTSDGKLFGMPWYAGVRSFVYRKDLFEKAGITEPKNWNELKTAAAKLKTADPAITALPVPGDAELTVYPWVWGAGGELATKQGDKYACALTDPKAQEGLSFWSGLAKEYSTPAAATWKETDLRDSFIKGQSAMILSGSWTPAAIEAKAPDLKGKIGAFAIPGKDGGLAGSFIGGSHLVSFENSKNKELAWEFIKMMTTGPLAEKWGTQTGFFPGQKELLKKATGSTDPLIKPFATQFVDGGKAVPVTPAFGKYQATKSTQAMMQAILTGKADVPAATKTACEAMNKAFSG